MATEFRYENKAQNSSSIKYGTNLYKTKSVPAAEGSSTFCFSESRSVWSCSSCCSTAAGTRCGWLTNIWERNCPMGDSSWRGAILVPGPDESGDIDEALTTRLLLLPAVSFLWPCLWIDTVLYGWQVTNIKNHQEPKINTYLKHWPYKLLLHK